MYFRGYCEGIFHIQLYTITGLKPQDSKKEKKTSITIPLMHIIK